MGNGDAAEWWPVHGQIVDDCRRDPADDVAIPKMRIRGDAKLLDGAEVVEVDASSSCSVLIVARDPAVVRDESLDSGMTAILASSDYGVDAEGELEHTAAESRADQAAVDALCAELRGADDVVHAPTVLATECLAQHHRGRLWKTSAHPQPSGTQVGSQCTARCTRVDLGSAGSGPVRRRSRAAPARAGPPQREPTAGARSSRPQPRRRSACARHKWRAHALSGRGAQRRPGGVRRPS